MSKRFSKIYVEITNYCNLNCSFCSKDSLTKKEMSIKEFEMVLEKIKDYTDNIYLHVKGEPLMHSNLDSILNICQKYHMKVSITTNGTLLKKKYDVLSKYNIKQINVSLHNENRLSNYFDDVFNTCDELSKKIVIVYRIWTLSSLKLSELSSSIVDKIINHYKLSTEIVDKIKNNKNIQINKNIYLDKDYEFKWPKINVYQEEVGTCLGTRTHIGILSNGQVIPCCLDSNGIVNLGNIFEDDMEYILNSSLFQEIYNGFLNHKITCDLCKSCTYRARFNKKM